MELNGNGLVLIPGLQYRIGDSVGCLMSETLDRARLVTWGLVQMLSLLSYRLILMSWCVAIQASNMVLAKAKSTSIQSQGITTRG